MDVCVLPAAFPKAAPPQDGIGWRGEVTRKRGSTAKGNQQVEVYGSWFSLNDPDRILPVVQEAAEGEEAEEGEEEEGEEEEGEEGEGEEEEEGEEGERGQEGGEEESSESDSEDRPLGAQFRADAAMKRKRACDDSDDDADDESD